MKDLVKERFLNEFGAASKYVFSCGGRFEIVGNHTDHNHGKCLAATCNLAITAAVSPRDDNNIKIISDGFGEINVNLDDLEHIKGDTSSKEIIKGIGRYFTENGYKIGGFDAFFYSTIFPGAGVSSSAAFELLIGKIFNDLYNDEKVPTLLMCKAGQYSENNYYEKSSGLLDQIGVAYGNLVSIDFEDIENPKIEEIPFPFEGLHFVLVNTGKSHIGLNDLYSSIPQDMFNAAKKTGHNFLRETTLDEINATKGLTDQEKNRAKHFFLENARVDDAINALKNNDREAFLASINGSRLNSTNYLKNMMIGAIYRGSPLEACARTMRLVNNTGATKINGGGFAGSIISVIPDCYIDYYLEKTRMVYGSENVCEIFIRDSGPKREE